MIKIQISTDFTVHQGILTNIIVHVDAHLQRNNCTIIHGTHVQSRVGQFSDHASPVLQKMRVNPERETETIKSSAPRSLSEYIENEYEKPDTFS